MGISAAGQTIPAALDFDRTRLRIYDSLVWPISQPRHMTHSGTMNFTAFNSGGDVAQGLAEFDIAGGAALPLFHWYGLNATALNCFATLTVEWRWMLDQLGGPTGADHQVYYIGFKPQTTNPCGTPAGVGFRFTDNAATCAGIPAANILQAYCSDGVAASTASAGAFQPGHWYTTRFDWDRSAARVDLYADDVLALSSVTNIPATNQLTLFALSAFKAGVNFPNAFFRIDWVSVDGTMNR